MLCVCSQSQIHHAHASDTYSSMSITSITSILCLSALHKTPATAAVEKNRRLKNQVVRVAPSSPHWRQIHHHYPDRRYRPQVVVEPQTANALPSYVNHSAQQTWYNTALLQLSVEGTSMACVRPAIVRVIDRVE